MYSKAPTYKGEHLILRVLCANVSSWFCFQCFINVVILTLFTSISTQEMYFRSRIRIKTQFVILTNLFISFHINLYFLFINLVLIKLTFHFFYSWHNLSSLKKLKKWILQVLPIFFVSSSSSGQIFHSAARQVFFQRMTATDGE